VSIIRQTDTHSGIKHIIAHALATILDKQKEKVEAKHSSPDIMPSKISHIKKVKIRGTSRN
jgi:hypothetical protein